MTELEVELARHDERIRALEMNLSQIQQELRESRKWLQSILFTLGIQLLVTVFTLLKELAIR